jgi:hypothetical protein
MKNARTVNNAGCGVRLVRKDIAVLCFCVELK